MDKSNTTFGESGFQTHNSATRDLPVMFPEFRLILPQDIQSKPVSSPFIPRAFTAHKLEAQRGIRSYSPNIMI